VLIHERNPQPLGFYSEALSEAQKFLGSVSCSLCAAVLFRNGSFMRLLFVWFGRMEVKGGMWIVSDSSSPFFPRE
jgi:hypothetical protein